MKIKVHCLTDEDMDMLVGFKRKNTEKRHKLDYEKPHNRTKTNTLRKHRVLVSNY